MTNRIMTDDQRAERLGEAIVSRVDRATLDRQLMQVAAESSHPVILAAGQTYEAYWRLLNLECAAAELQLRAAAALLDVSESADYPLLRWFAHHVLADCLDERGWFDEALEHLDIALEIAKEFHLVEQWERSCANLIFVQRRIGNAVLAAQAVEDLLTSDARVEPSQWLPSILSDLYLWLNLPQHAIRLRLAQAADQGWTSRGHREAAIAYLHTDELAAAEEHIGHATALSATTNADENLRLTALAARLAAASGNFETALSTAQDYATVAGRAGLVVAEGEGRLQIANALLRLGKPEEAAVQLQLIDAKRIGSPERRIWYRLMAELAEQDEDWDSAAKYWAEVVALRRLASLSAPATSTMEQAVADYVEAVVVTSRDATKLARLRRALRDRDKVLLLAAKDLRGPLAAMHLASQLLAGGADRTSLLPMLRSALAELDLTAKQLAEVAFWEEPDDSIRWERVDVERTISDAVASVAPVASDRDIAIYIAPSDGFPSIRSVGEALTRCLAFVFWVETNLAAAGANVEVRAVCEADRLTILCEVATERRLSADDLRGLFSWSRPLQAGSPVAVVGSVTGLSVARTGIERLGGSLEVEFEAARQRLTVSVELAAGAQT